MADALDGHDRLLDPLLHHRRQDGGSGRRGQLRLDRGSSQRHALEQFRRARGGDRHQAVGALDRAAAGRDRPAGDPFCPEQVEGNRRADDVRDAVQGADFMKVNLLQRHAVGRGLRLGEPAKNPQGQVALPLGQPAALQDRLHIGQEAVLGLVLSLDADGRRREPALADLLDFQRDRQLQRGQAGANGLLRRRPRRAVPPESCRR